MNGRTVVGVVFLLVVAAAWGEGGGVAEPGGLDDPTTTYPAVVPGDPPSVGNLPGMSDREWCLRQAEHWETNGVDVPDDSVCQDQLMSFWRSHRT